MPSIFAYCLIWFIHIYFASLGCFIESQLIKYIGMVKFLSFFILLLLVNFVYAQEVKEGLEGGRQGSIELIQDIRKSIDYIRINISDITKKIDSMGEKLMSFQQDVTKINYEVEKMRKVVEEFKMRIDSIEDKVSSIDKERYNERLNYIDLRVKYLMGGLSIAYGGIIASFIILFILIFVTRGKRRGRGEFIFKR